MRVVVTGAAGFIGSHLSECLVAGGHDVLGIDNRSGAYATADNLAALDGHPRFALAGADLATDRLRPLLRGAGAVVHLAGRAGVRGAAQEGYLEENVIATLALVHACRAAGVRRVVFASSSSVYAATPGATAEDAPLDPRSVYGRTKLACERLWAESGLGAVVLRYFTVYGPRQRPDMAFARFVAAALDGTPAPLFGDGRQVRDFTYVADAVEGTVRALEHGRPGATYNLSGGRPLRLRSALELLGDALGRPVPFRPEPSHPAEARRTRADLSRAARDLRYRPAVALPEGVRRQVAAALAERERAAVAA